MKKTVISLCLIIGLTFLAYMPSLQGAFVYDDNRQIEANPLIQNPNLYIEALKSDVWAFKADGSVTVSNYWRPTFVAWMIFNHKLFGLDPVPWHWMNLFIHFLVVIFLYALFRLWGINAGTSLAITTVFSVHPVHVESVAWISGSPDILFALFITLSLICWQFCITSWNQNKYKRVVLLILSLALYALALGAKEVAILFPIVFILLAFWQGNLQVDSSQPSYQQPNKNLIAYSLLFLLLAVLYFVLRAHILGFVSKPQSETLSLIHFVLTIPKVFLFYLEQLIFPVTTGANFPLRITNELTVTQVLSPLILLIALFFLLLKISSNQRVYQLGLLLLIIPLLPAFNLFAFHHEQLVHHRYLYFPVVGFLMILIVWWQTNVTKTHRKLSIALWLSVLVIFTYQSWRFSHLWKTNHSLWNHTTQIDKDSAFNWQQLANVQLENGDLDEALESFGQSIEVENTARALYGLAKTQHLSGQNGQALQSLNKLLTEQRNSFDLYLFFQFVELKAVILTESGQLQAAELHLRNAINELPIYHALLADKLAVVLYLNNKKAQALQVLESAKNDALIHSHIAAKMIFFRLGLIHQEMGNSQSALSNFRTFLEQTKHNSQTDYLDYKKIAETYLSQFK